MSDLDLKQALESDLSPWQPATPAVPDPAELYRAGPTEDKEKAAQERAKRAMQWQELEGRDLFDLAGDQARFLSDREAQDPPGHRERHEVALWLAQQLSLDPATVYGNLDLYMQQMAGEDLAPQRLWEATRNAWKTGWITNRKGKLLWEKATGATAARRATIDAELAELEKRLPPEDPVARRLLGKTAQWIAGSLPLMIQGGIEGAKYGLVSAGAAAAASGLAGASLLGPAAVSGVGTAPALSAVGLNMLTSSIYAFQVGTRVGATVEMSKIMAGLAYESLETIRDPEGRGLHPAVLSSLSVGIGLFQGLLENMQMSTILAAYPGMDKIFGEGVERVVKDTVLKTVGNRSLKVAAKFGVDALQEGVEEGAQELVMMMGENLANFIVNHQDAQLFDYNSVQDIAERVRESFVAGVMAGGGMLLPGYIMRPFSDARATRIEAREHAAWQRYEQRQALLDQVFDDTPIEQRQAAMDPEAARSETVPPLEPTEERILEERPESEVAQTTLEEELRRQAATGVAWQHTQEEWENVKELREKFAEGPESSVSAYKDIFSPQALPIRMMIAKAAPHFTIREVEGAALLLDVLAQGTGSSTYDFARSIFAPGIFAGPAEIASLGPRAMQEAQEKAIAQGATPEQVQQAVAAVQAKVAAAKGVTEFLEDGRALVYLLQTADFSTWVHEVGHILRRRLPDALMQKAAKWAGVNPGEVWSPEAEEKFADGLVEYLRNGYAPNEEVRQLFQKIAEWLEYIYRAVRDRWELSPEIREVYDSLFERRDDQGGRLRIDPNPRPNAELDLAFRFEVAPEAEEFAYREEVRGAHHGQVDLTAFLNDAQGKVLSWVDYSIFEGEIHLGMVKTAETLQRRGYGTELLKWVIKNNPGQPVRWGMMTEAGVALRKRVEAELAREKDPAPMPDDQFLRRSQYEAEVNRVYLDDAGNQRSVPDKDGRQLKVSSRTTPIPDLKLREGMWLVDDTWKGIHGRDIAQLRRFDARKTVYAWDNPRPGELALSENAVETNAEGRGWDADRYAGWIRDGLTPPPISVVEHQDGHFTVTDGHRRVKAAQITGSPLYAWVWPAMADPEGRTDADGAPLRVGMTFEGVKGHEYVPGKIDKEQYLFQVDTKKQKKIIDALIAEVGFTKDPNEAGYILPDGRMLNYSGVSLGYADTGGRRLLDHAFMPKSVQKMLYSELKRPPRSDADVRAWLMHEAGLFRVDVGSGILNAGAKITEAQMGMIKSAFPTLRKANNLIYLEVSRKNGTSAVSKGFYQPIWSDVKKWFEANAVYEQEITRAFQVDPKIEARIQAVTKELRDFFGTTNDLKRGAYILASGELLNFANKWGETKSEMQGERMVHRMISKVPAIGILDAVNSALRNAVIRVDYDERFSIIQTMYPPRPEQWPALRRITKGTDQVMLEYVDRRTGSMIAFRQIDFPDEATVRAFFAKAKRQDPHFLYQTDPFVLKSTDVVLQKMADNMPGKQIKNLLAKNGVTPDELHWVGLDDFLEDAKQYRRDELLKFIDDHAIRLEEVVFGPYRGMVGEAPRYGNRGWQSEGGENYREVIYRLPTAGELQREIIPGREIEVRQVREELQRTWDQRVALINEEPQDKSVEGWRRHRTERAPVLQGLEEKADELMERMNELTRPVQRYAQGTEELRQIGEPAGARPPGGAWEFVGGHYHDYANIVGWIRIQDYELGGKKTLLVDEYQSEWAETAKHVGFSDVDSLRRLMQPFMDHIQAERRSIEEWQRRIADLEAEYALLDKEVPRPQERINAMSRTMDMLNRNILKTQEQIDEFAASARTVLKDQLVPSAPFLASRAWGIFVDGKEWESEQKQTQRFGNTEEAEKFIAKKQIPGAMVVDLGYIENTRAWAGQLFKRALRWAVEQGYDTLAWTDGATQNRRWSLSAHIDSLRWTYNTDKTYDIHGIKDGSEVVTKRYLAPEELDAYVGKEVAERIRSGVSPESTGPLFSDTELQILRQGRVVEVIASDREGAAGWYQRREDGSVMGVWDSRRSAEADATRWNVEVNRLRDLDRTGRGTRGELIDLQLELGGRFMKLLYDKIVVNYAEKYTKQWGGQVEERFIGRRHYVIHNKGWGRFAINLDPDASIAQYASWEDVGVGHVSPDTPAMFESAADAKKVAEELFNPDSVPDAGRWLLIDRRTDEAVAHLDSLDEAEDAIDSLAPDLKEGYYLKDRKLETRWVLGTFNFGDPTDKYVLVQRGTLGMARDTDGQIVGFDTEAELWQWAAENAHRLLELAQRIWALDITERMRLSVKDGIFQQFLFQPSEHEQAVQEAVIRGEPVPQDVLEQYKERDWAKEEIKARKVLLEEARTQEFRDLEEFVTFHQAMDPGAPKSPEYYALIWELAGGDLNVSGEEGFTPLSPTEANKRFLESLNSPEKMQGWLDTIGGVTFTRESRKGTVGGAMAGWEKLPRAVRNAGIESSRGVLSVAAWKAAYAVMKADPKYYREIEADATADQEQILQLQAEREMPPAEEERLRRENERLRRELKMMREWEQDIIAQDTYGKKAWQLTKREWVARWPRTEKKPWDFLQRHEDAVREAVEADLPVPPEVLVEYRELRKLYEDRRAAGIELQALEELAPVAEAAEEAGPSEAEKLAEQRRVLVEERQAEIATLEAEKKDLTEQVLHWAQRAAVETAFGQVVKEKEAKLAAVEKKLDLAKERQRQRDRLAAAKAQYKAQLDRLKLRQQERRQRERQKQLIVRLRKIHARLPHMTAEAAGPIREILEGIELAYRGQRAVLRIEKLRAALSGEDMEYAVNELDRLGLLERKNIMELTTEEFYDLWQAVQHWVSFHQQAEAMRVYGERWRHKEAVQRALGEMRPLPEIEKDLVRLSPGVWESLKDKAGAVWDELLGIGQSQYILLVEQVAGTKSIVFDILGRQIEEGRRKQLGLYQKYEDYFETEANALGLGNLSQWLHEETTFRLGRGGGLVLRRGEKLALFMLSQDEDARASILGRGIGSRRSKSLRVRPVRISEDLLAELEGSITEGEKKFIGVVRALFDMTWEDMNPVYEERYGHPMARIANWYHKDTMPYGRGSTVADQKAAEELRKRKLRPGIPHGRIKERAGVQVPVYVNSIEHDIYQAIQYAARYAGLEIPIAQAAKLLYDPDFSTGLAGAYGERLHRYLVDGVRDTVAETESLSTVENFFAKTRMMIQIAYLSMNPFSMLKIFLGFANANVYVDINHLARGYAESAAHPRTIEQRNLAMSPYYRDRIARGFTRDIAEGLKSQREGALVGAKRKLPEIGMRPIQFADRASISPVMQGAVLQVLDDFARGELSPGTETGIGHLIGGRALESIPVSERIELAYRFADFVVQRTQDQRLPEYRSALSRASAWGGFVKYFTMFGSNTNTNLNVLRRAITQFQYSDRGRTATHRLIKTSLLMLVVVPISEAMVNAMRNYLLRRYDEDEDKILSILADYVRELGGLVYFVRDMVDAAVGAIQGRSREFTIPPVQLVNDAFRLIRQGVSLATETNWMDRERKAWAFVDGIAEFILMVGQIPLLMPKRYIQELIRKAKE